ncbi:alpha/beta fold hydrolase [Dactylosporangium sp. CA-233914]|uniref:alpha/beta fold hydrolase n=1 Tax=Dactylosporangium sp. CA-233914 TaxID=3239934 RepID=UPI003D8A49B1
MTTTGRVRAGDVEIAYSESGSGEPVILIHGGESSRAQYDAFRPLLGAGIRAVAYDQRDTGDSVNPAAPYGTEDLARDCAALIRGLGYSRAHVFGASFGGIIALQLAITVPDAVQTLMLGATVSRVSFSAGSTAGDIVALSPQDRTQRMLDFVLSPQAQASQELMAETLGILLHRPPAEDARRLDAVRNFDITEQLPEITAPTLLIYGEDDPSATPEKGRALAAAIPGARLETIPKIRHGITIEGKDTVARLIREFVLAHPSN